MPAPIKICTRRSFRNRRGACSEIEEAFAFSKAGLLRDHEGWISEIEEAFAFSKVGLLKDHEGRSQKSKRRSLSQKLGYPETTRADLRNRRGTYFFSLVSTCHTHTQLCGNYRHSVKDFWGSRKHMNLTVQSPTSHTQQ
ncbi:hypothetical protein PS2_007806 [Malus domestica]